MACGTPVVTSRGGATEEVAGGAAVSSTRPTRRRSRAASRRPSARRDELVAAGLERARAFTWQHAADLVEALWRELT